MGVVFVTEQDFQYCIDADADTVVVEYAVSKELLPHVQELPSPVICANGKP